MTGYIPILIMIVVAAVIAAVMVFGSALLGPKHPTKYKSSTYESGMTPVGTARERFPVRFYLIAMLFIIFDIETIFLYPWVVAFGNPGIATDRAVKVFLLVEMAVFVAILFVGYFYILGKGALDWNEAPEGTAREEPRIFERRPPILFGNERSGPVRLPALLPESPDVGPRVSREEAEDHAPAPTVGGG